MDNYVGKRLDGRYEIREIIGVGGMSVVYKAYDNIDDRIVAVKILKEEFLANEEFRRRFKNESKAIAVLSHSNIVKVYDVSFGDRLQYIVMEYVEGITLKEYIEQQKVIAWKEALHFVIQILRALQHAHDKGIVHRDIKPQNIMLLQNGTIKVTDFGIARFSRGETRSMTESAIGSVHYISPEQARGELTDDKADIYSVGVVLYEMLTGALPFEGDSAVSVALMQVQDEAKTPHEINPDIPLGLEQITMKAMQKSTRDRYQSAAEMLLDLEEFKRNPLIKFDYTYFVDEEPTKYVDSTHIPKVKPFDEETLVSETAETNSDTKSRVIPILAGIVFSLILFAVILVVIQLAKNGSIFGGKKIEIANFVGMNYTQEIQDNADYTDVYNFQVDYLSNSAYEPGTVFAQDPEAGQTITKGGTVKLSVVMESNSLVIPDVSGISYAEAEHRLRQQGFQATQAEVEDSSVAIGNVVGTSPEKGQTAPAGSIVTVYVSAEIKNNTVTVPKLIDSNIEVAKEIIGNLGLAIGNITEKDSTTTAGTVISQSPAENTSVEKGTKVDLVISTGKVASSSVDLSVQLPDVGKVTLEVCVNDIFVGDAVTINAEGQVRTVTVSGSGANNVVAVFVGGQKIYQAYVDFTTSPATVSNEMNYDYTMTISTTGQAIQYEYVVGKNGNTAKEELNDAGFSNVVFQFDPTKSGTKGTVYKQSPDYSVLTKLSPDTAITLYIIGSETDLKTGDDEG